MTRTEKYTHGINLITIALLAAFAYTSQAPAVPAKHIPTQSQKWAMMVTKMAGAVPMRQLSPLASAGLTSKFVPVPKAKHAPEVAGL